MMTREWGPTGVTGFRPADINAQQRHHLRLELRNHGINEISAEFFDSLSRAIGHYLANRRLAEESKPGAVRANLKDAIDAGVLLNEKLNALDGSARQLLGEVGAEIDELQNKHLRRIVLSLDDALNRADEYQKKGGRLFDYGRLWLAVDVGHAVEQHLKVRATSKVEGLYESILAIALGIATGRNAESVHDLARRAIKAMALNKPGEYEHIP